MSDHIELQVGGSGNAFGVTPDQLNKLIDPKDPETLQKLGGVQGIAEALHSDTKKGLPVAIDSEAYAQARLETFGKNILPPPRQETFFDMVFGALQDKVLLLLIGAAVISIILGSIPQTSSHPETGWFDGLAILVAVIIVVSVQSGNDYQKQKQFAKLNEKKENRTVNVVRDAEQMQISVFALRVGDILMLETGDVLPVDGIFIEGHSLKVDESSVTGESDPIKKGHSMGDQDHGKADPFFLSGSQVIEGVGRMLVIAVGTQSFNGRIMLALDTPDEETPLQAQLEVLAETIGKFGLLAAGLLLLIGIPKYFGIAAQQKRINTAQFKKEVGNDMVRLIINAITIVVVAVPEGLPLAVTIALAYGTIKMLQDNNLVRHLAACETMGGATNVCSDKTGTLTQNVMTVVTGWFCGKTFTEINDRTAQELNQGFSVLFAESVAINSNAFETTTDGGKTEIVGSKTEVALLKMTRALGHNFAQLRERNPVFQLYPFTSARKRMSTVVKIADGHYRIFVKGASEIVLGMCTRVLVGSSSSGADTSAPVEAREMPKELRNTLNKVINDFASDALRTIGIAYADIYDSNGKINWEDAPEGDLTLLGIVGIRDPLRPEVPQAVATCQRAGITVRMVTGDNIVTAENIAKSCGILTPGGICMEGPKFRELSVEQMDKIIPRLQVLARSSPTDKQLLVGRLKALGEVVAVTGDGTNDAPALKMADIGFSMGIAGTEVAKSASDVILIDDNFASIVKAALWGRNIYDSIRKFVQFQATVNVVAVTIAFVGSLSGDHAESPLTAVQLLWVNLIMDSMAALALATELPTPDLLDRKPVGRGAPIITRNMWKFIIGHSIYQLIVMFVVLYAGHKIFGEKEVPYQSKTHLTMLFNSFVFMQLFNELNARRLGAGNDSVFKGLFANRFFPAIIFITICVQILFVEVGGDFTSTTHLTWWQWLICVFIGSIELPWGYLVRAIPIADKEPPASKLSLTSAYEDTDNGSNEPLVVGGEPSTGSHGSHGSKYGLGATSDGQVSRAPRHRRWSLVREAVKKIGVISAWRSMKNYRMVGM